MKKENVGPCQKAAHDDESYPPILPRVRKVAFPVSFHQVQGTRLRKSCFLSRGAGHEIVNFRARPCMSRASLPAHALCFVCLFVCLSQGPRGLQGPPGSILNADGITGITGAFLCLFYLCVCACLFFCQPCPTRKQAFSSTSTTTPAVSPAAALTTTAASSDAHVLPNCSSSTPQICLVPIFQSLPSYPPHAPKPSFHPNTPPQTTARGCVSNLWAPPN